jgi:hypothetical protein
MEKYKEISCRGLYLRYYPMPFLSPLRRLEKPQNRYSSSCESIPGYPGYEAGLPTAQEVILDI